MKIVLIFFIFIPALLFAQGNNLLARLTRIPKANELSEEAGKSFTKGDFKKASLQYKELVEKYGTKTDQALINLANAQYKSGNIKEAISNYKNVENSLNKDFQSIARLQQGNIAFKQNDYPLAINHYKAALKTNPNNETARYNLELVKKLQQKQNEEKEKNKPRQDQKDKQNREKNKEDQKSDSKNEDSKNQDKKDADKKGDKGQDKKENASQKKDEKDKNGQEPDKEKEDDKGIKSDEKKEDGKKPDELDNKNMKEAEKKEMDSFMADKNALKKMGLSEDKAKMLLEAMKNSEIQYLQQKQFNKKNTKKERGKPDW